MRWRVVAGLALALAPAVCAASCSSNSVDSGFCPNGCADAAAAGDALKEVGDGPPMFVGDHGAPKSLSVVPANSSLQITDLSALPTAQLSAKVLYTDGTTSSVDASWTVDRIDIASIGAGTGLVTPTGTVFGKVTATAQAFGLTGSTSITVSLQATVNLSNISPGDASQLAGATTPDPAVIGLAYPYDKTVFPGGLAAPAMMWNLSSAGDEYLVHYVATGFDLSVLTTADPPSRFTLPSALWNTLTASVAGGNVTVQLQRLPADEVGMDAGEAAYLSATQTWTIANANLRGIVYYWNISQGQILQADPTTGQVMPVFDPGSYTLLGNPPPQDQSQASSPPWENNGTGDRCVACHAVSKNGSTLAATFSTGGSTGPSGYVGLQSRLVSAIGDYPAQGMFTAIAPDGLVSVMNTATRTMQLLDGTTGLGISSALDGLTNVCDPVFSPDGTLFALASNCTGGTGQVLEFSSSNLTVYSFDEPTQTFTNPSTILTSGAAGAALAFPSFSPDSKWIFFQGGSYSRAKYGTNLHGYDDLYVVAAQPGATPIALDTANGTNVLPSDSQHIEYAPTVSPIVQGGYFWVVFTTPRDYGNLMVSPEQAAPNDATYYNHKQLWVAAVDATIGTTDPSHPAFWLPGQDQGSANMFGYWALAPCEASEGDAGPPSCATGFECCSGFCRDLGNGPVCTGNPGGCHQLGEVCSTSADCCNAGSSVACLAGICQSYTAPTQ
jgi:hypothetical protein